MKIFRSPILVLILICSMSLPIVLTAPVHAQATGIICFSNVENYTTEGCDLSVNKQVSVNGSVFIEAHTSDAARQAQIGDTVTWKIIVTNNSTAEQPPVGNVTLSDLMPSGFTESSHLASVGAYSSGEWSFGLSGDNLPATLTITGIADKVGLMENIATLSTYDPCGDNAMTESFCIDPAYEDSDNTNNSSNAFVNVTAIPIIPITPATPVTPETPPVVTSPSKTPDTGFGLSSKKSTFTLPVFVLGAASLVSIAFMIRKYSK
jgi:uncharacterized repeat protein (TIGR01451 family)